jgi:uncharacterized protein YecE (DUF72 family)
MAKIHIGTSGWHYPHWRGRFYPGELPVKKWLDYYVERFGALEINNSFYRLPSREVMTEWYARTPANFRFTVKASRFLTHNKKLSDPEEPITRLYDRIEPLADRLGALLFQLPPRWKPNPERLAAFLELLPAELPPVFEFRDRRWECEEVFAVLREHRASFCVADIGGEVSPREVTGPIVYLRLHGATAQKYTGSYPDDTLRDWGQWLKTCSRKKSIREVYAFFDNDQDAHAPLDGLRLKEITD